MSDRLSANDAAFLYAQDANSPTQVGGVVILQPDPADDSDAYDRIAAHIASRLPLVPRYRQKVKVVPGRLARPVWVDDEDFDLTYHVRRSALPKPGNDSQLDDLVGRLISRALDRDRPLWEMYVVEGLSGDRIAVINKTHEALVDRLGAVDLAAAILDIDRTPEVKQTQAWIPQPAPSAVDLVVDAVTDLTARPSELIDLASLTILDVRTTVDRVSRIVNSVAGIVKQTVSPAPQSGLGSGTTDQRRFSRFDADLNAFRQIRSANEGTVNDVVLTVLTGALRGWLLSRGEPVTDASGIRALVPMSVRTSGESAPVTSFLVTLPIAEPSPVMRLHQVAFQTRGHAESGRQVSADAIARLGRYTPPTLHALGARVGFGLSRRSYNLLVTNVPGPQFPLYVAGDEVASMYPVAPLVRGHSLAVACTSYRGRVYFGLTADRVALPDVAEFATLVGEAVDELADTIPHSGQRTGATKPRKRSGK